MKAAHIIRIIEAHKSGDENAFEKAIMDLIADEERKGNSSVALAFRDAYFSGGKLVSPGYSGQGIHASKSMGLIPKDKDSTLDLIEVQSPHVKLSDVALGPHTQRAIDQVIAEHRNREELGRRGILPTSRLIFCGPPGCGKTVTAYALAQELDMPVAYVKLDGVVSSYLGQTGTNLSKIFDFVHGKRLMLFLDEFDAIAKKRDDSHELGELKRVVTTLLQKFDALSPETLVVAATNHDHLLDPAVWRRFEMSIRLEEPDEGQRETILKRFAVEHDLGYNANSELLVKLTAGMSGAQIVGFLQSLAKYWVMQGGAGDAISTEEIGTVWLNHFTLYADENSDSYVKALQALTKHGISVRVLEKISGIPKSTLSYRLKKEATLNGRGQ